MLRQLVESKCKRERRGEISISKIIGLQKNNLCGQKNGEDVVTNNRKVNSVVNSSRVWKNLLKELRL